MHTDANDTPAVAGLVLAAGFSRRFGTDKRLARVQDGRALLAASLQVPCAVLEQVWVVLHEGDDPVQLAVSPQVRIVHSQDAAEGMGNSLACGVRTISPASTACAVAVLLGDMPCLQRETLQALVRVASAERIVLPVFNGVAGHPVLFGRRFWPELECLQGAQGAKAVLLAHADAVQRVAVSDAGVLLDIDTPEQLHALVHERH
ncbi:nucleotidyltransferase family protein [Pseudomonas aegrilactucae]|uniref:Nucleotidyltransferase family protein n=1 Tax=Pseudomonas aegrilactucae TaxID=2854028 RepID=A0A9Q2XG24_9PSED|nr:nucleotidyltransferase family protein [Pseudomonas aegrilactucae]MBV6286071.1 nucleotidyltransferase family protein [Pseudomonas aegrilactucae]